LRTYEVAPIRRISQKEGKVKKLKKLEIKKVTLRNLDEVKLEAVAGGLTGSGPTACPQICNITKIKTCVTC